MALRCMGLAEPPRRHAELTELPSSTVHWMVGRLIIMLFVVRRIKSSRTVLQHCTVIILMHTGRHYSSAGLAHWLVRWLPLCDQLIFCLSCHSVLLLLVSVGSCISWSAAAQHVIIVRSLQLALYIALTALILGCSQLSVSTNLQLLEKFIQLGFL